MEKLFSFSDFLMNHSHEPFFILLMLMVVIWTAGRIFAYIELPMILGEILAGIVLGPAVLGWVQETETIKVLADLGIFFMMFHAGLDTDVRDLLKASKGAFITSFGSIVSIVAAVFCMWRFFPGIFFDTSVLGVFFIGLILAVASFPIIMRMLRHFNLKRTNLGKSVMASAIFSEVVVFVGISILLSLYSSGNFDIENVLSVVLKTAIFFLGTLFIGKIILPWFSAFLNRTGAKAFTFSLIVALVFSLFAEFIGLHFILGTYLGGMFVREEIENEKIFAKIEDRYFGFSYSFLGPIFFATVGLSVSLDVFETYLWEILAIVFLISFVQILSSGVIMRFIQKYSWKESFIAASALLGRGAVDVVIAKVAYEVGVFSENMFSLLVGAILIIIFVSSFLLEFAVLFLKKKA